MAAAAPSTQGRVTAARSGAGREGKSWRRWRRGQLRRRRWRRGPQQRWCCQLGRRRNGRPGVRGEWWSVGPRRSQPRRERALCFVERAACCAPAGRKPRRLGPSPAFGPGAGPNDDPAVTMAARPPPVPYAGPGAPCCRRSARESDILRQDRPSAVSAHPSSSSR